MVVDAKGTPLCAVLSGANINDHLVLAIRNGKPGRARRRPDKMHADKAYDFEVWRHGLLERGIVPRVARRGIESSERLGRFRWVVERTPAWLSQYRRLKIRYEQRDDIHQAFVWRLLVRPPCCRMPSWYLSPALIVAMPRRSSASAPTAAAPRVAAAWIVRSASPSHPRAAV